VVFSTGFEETDPKLDLVYHTVVTDAAYTGQRSLFASVAQPGEFRFVNIPFVVENDSPVELSFWAKSDTGTRTAVFASAGSPGAEHTGNAERIFTVAPLPDAWTHLSVIYRPQFRGAGNFMLFAPAAIQAPVGGMWIDNIEIARVELPEFTRPYFEDYPALAGDAAGQVWMAVLAHPIPGQAIHVYKAEQESEAPICVLMQEKAFSVGPPEVTGLDSGCFVAYAVEIDKRWRIAYAFLDTSGAVTADGLVETDGNVNIHPAAAALDGRVCLLWESNPAGMRGIYTCWVDVNGATLPRRLSAAATVSCNPDVVRVGTGEIFVAWDSVRDAKGNIYGAGYRSGEWQSERRLTDGAWLEREPALAAHEREVWLTWEIKACTDHQINAPQMQSIALARLDRDALAAPLRFQSDVARSELLLVRPRIRFDAKGRLWLTARQSMSLQSGWQPMAWSYDGATWSGPHPLWMDEGRSQPVDMAWNNDGQGIAAVQRDRFAGRGDLESKSEVMLVALDESWAASASQPFKTEPLTMPPMDFTLTKRMDQGAADFPRQHAEHQGETLTLFWGDLHEHTNVSACQRAVNPPAHDLFANQRDIEKLDFTALTDHGCHLDERTWQYLQAQTTGSYDPGRFVTFLAEEWTSDQVEYDPPRTYKRYGHRNVIFLDPRFPRFYNSRKGNWSPRQLWDNLAEAEYITIPHQLADHGTNCPTDWSFTDDRLQPLAEIFQQRESYEYEGCPRQAEMVAPGHFLQDAWAMGIIIGVIASPDHGGGHGKAGIWARELTRESLFEAFRARHTFGTSDPKMLLFVTSGDAMMGDVVKREGKEPIPFYVRAAALRPIHEIVIWRNNEIVYRAEPNATTIEIDWTDDAPLDVDHAWYYVRLHCADNELAWSSPIWFTRSKTPLLPE
jgi:hypothetical protein